MGYVYKFTIRDNGKWYIGSHNGNKKDYQGSGLLWKKALKKYGKDSYETEILYEGDFYREMEETILKELDAASDNMSYNMKNEALGGSFPGELNGMYGKTLSDEQRYACGSVFRGKKRPDHSENMSGEGNPMYGKNEHAHGLIQYAKDRTGTTNKEYFGEEKADEISKKISEANLGKPKLGTSKAMKGSGNPAAISITIDNIEYGSIVEAMEKLGLSRYKVRKLAGVS